MKTAGVLQKDAHDYKTRELFVWGPQCAHSVEARRRDASSAFRCPQGRCVDCLAAVRPCALACRSCALVCRSLCGDASFGAHVHDSLTPLNSLENSCSACRDPRLAESMTTSFETYFGIQGCRRPCGTIPNCYRTECAMCNRSSCCPGQPLD